LFEEIFFVSRLPVTKVLPEQMHREEAGEMACPVDRVMGHLSFWQSITTPRAGTAVT